MSVLGILGSVLGVTAFFAFMFLPMWAEPIFIHGVNHLSFDAATSLGPYRIRWSRYGGSPDGTWISVDGKSWRDEATGERPWWYKQRRLRAFHAWQVEKVSIAELEKSYKEFERSAVSARVEAPKASISSADVEAMRHEVSVREAVAAMRGRS